MKKLIAGLFTLAILSGCTLLSPSQLILKNSSPYPIRVTTNKPGYENFELDKSKYCNMQILPGSMSLKIEITPAGFVKEYQLEIPYQSKAELNFTLDDY